MKRLQTIILGFGIPNINFDKEKLNSIGNEVPGKDDSYGRLYTTELIVDELLSGGDLNVNNNINNVNNINNDFEDERELRDEIDVENHRGGEDGFYFG